MPGILVILAQPQLEQSRVAAVLAIAAKAVATAAPALTSTPTQATTISVRDLYTLDPDYLVDVAAEQAALAEVDLLVWLHPVHWYGMPPLMKLWLDEVFAFGWAYGAGRHHWLPGRRHRHRTLGPATGDRANSHPALG